MIVLGPRGVGKTTLLLQRLAQLNLPPQKALYVDLGDLYFQANHLIEFIEQFVEQGGTHLFIDEVHRYGYGDWAPEIKAAYDRFRKRLRIVLTGSSVIKLLREKADLSRRALKYRMLGLSFREYLRLAHDWEVGELSLQEILTDGPTIAARLLRDTTAEPTALLRAYWKMGYFPFFLERPGGYVNRLVDTVQTVLEHDIPYGTDQGSQDSAKLGRLLYAVASSAPFKPNLTKMGERLGINRRDLTGYLDQLEAAQLIIGLRQESRGIGSMGKPDKLYLDNPNLVHALAPVQEGVGMLRETFFLNQLSFLTHQPSLVPPEIRLPKKGDFALLTASERYVFEIGGRSKGRQQLAGEENAYTVVDTGLSGSPNRIPLWLFGLLY